MWDFQLLAAMRSIESAMPLVLHRVLTCLGIAFGYLLATLAGAGIGFAVGAMLSDAPNAFGRMGAMGGFALFAWVLYKTRGFLLHGVWAGHLALLAALRRGEKVPTGWKLVDHAQGLVKSRFATAGELAALDTGIRNVLRCYPACFLDMQASLPWRHPRVTRALNRIAGEMSALADQLALAEALSPSVENPWRAARDTLGRCAASWPMLFRNLAWLHLFMNLGWLLAYLVIRAPFADIAALLPIDVPVWTEIFALVFSWALKTAFFEIIAAAALLPLSASLQESRRGWQSLVGECPALVELEQRAKEKRAPASAER
jgi:hypothetical protein